MLLMEGLNVQEEENFPRREKGVEALKAQVAIGLHEDQNGWL